MYDLCECGLNCLSCELCTKSECECKCSELDEDNDTDVYDEDEW